MEKVIRKGKVAVVISTGYGAGWYSWSDGNKELLFHPKLIEMIESGRQKEITEEWVLDNLGIKDVYCGGNHSLTIKWINEGNLFKVDEYDGSESISVVGDSDYIVA